MRALLLAAALACAPAIAHADDKAKAIALFDEGAKGMKAGTYAEACKAFAASLALVPDSGTRGSLARCYGKLGRIASAWRLWRELADTAPTADLRADARRQADKLDGRLPRYVITVAPGAMARTVTFDGERVDPTVTVPVPVDPGRHVVEATADGHAAWRHELTAVEGETVAIEVPALTPLPAPLVVAPPVDTAPPGRGRRRTATLVIGAGAAVAITGGVFGVVARGRYGDAEDACGGDIDRCAPANLDAAQAKVDSARSAATISTVLFAVGGAAIIGGVVLYLTAPAADERAVTVAPLVGADHAGLAITGGF